MAWVAGGGVERIHQEGWAGRTERRSRWLVGVALVASLIACGGSPATHSAQTPKPPDATIPVEPLGGSGGESSGSGGGAEVSPSMVVHLIDVGQGASTLLEFSCGAILIDTGGESNNEFSSNDHLTAYLAAFFKRRSDLKDTLDLLLITHPHIDHARGIKSVWDAYHVKNVVTDGLTTSSGGVQQGNLIKWAKESKIGLEAIKAGVIPEGGLTDEVIDPVKCDDQDPDIRVLWGAVDKSDAKEWPKASFDNVNNHSVVVKVTFGKSSLLITGDLEEDGLAGLLAAHASSLDADVYEVGHHGSDNATSKALLEAVTPKIAIIGLGANTRKEMWTAWKYGHPRLATIELLENALTGPPRAEIDEPVATGATKFEQHSITAPIFSTGWDGDVDLTLYASGSIGVNAQTSTPP